MNFRRSLLSFRFFFKKKLRCQFLSQSCWLSSRIVREPIGESWKFHIVDPRWITNVGDFLLRNERPTCSYPRHAFNRATFNPAADRVSHRHCIMQHTGDIAVPSRRVCLRLIRTRSLARRVRVCHVITMLSREQDLTLVGYVARSSRGLQLSAMRCRCFYPVTWLPFETTASLPIYRSLSLSLFISFNFI